MSGPERALLGGSIRRVAMAALALALAAACAHSPVRSAAPETATVDRIVQAIASRPIVLLGEVHDNAAQHALRLEALRRLVDGGARPAIAFEQFDADRQAALDEARAHEGASLDERVARVIEAAGAKGWNWDFYRPYLALALDRNLPVVAANLSRAQAMRVAQEGAASVFDPAQRARMGLDDIDPELEQAQEAEIERGHCGRMPKDALPSMAAAQIARDATLALAIHPYVDRGVVLLTGNGHARRDIGVPQHLAPQERARTVSIGLLEDDGESARHADAFDFAFLTPVQARPDPCAALEHKDLLPHQKRN